MRLKAGREKSLQRRHPWVFSGAVQAISGDPAAGDTIRITAQDGSFLGWGAYSPQSQIRARVWSWEEDERIDASFFAGRLKNAIDLRKRFIQPDVANGVRLVHGESDGLPGLVVDLYGEWAVVQLLSAGPERWKKEIIQCLTELVHLKGVYERSDADVRRLEGLAERTGLIWGDEPPERALIAEYGLQYWLDLRKGHKTGFYLDQRENRLRLRQLARGADVLDCFSYTGGFSLNALFGGAKSVTAVEASAEALQMARANLELNQLGAENYSEIQADVFQQLRAFRDQRRTFDLIVLDPPKFAPTAALAEKAARGYKDINLLALKLLRPGGLLFTFSCSGGIDMPLFQKILAGAALDAGVQAVVVEWLHQAADHPVGLAFPEGEYLKGLVIGVANATRV